MTPRLFVTDDLAAGIQLVLAKEQAHYLGNVLRRKVDDAVLLFNGRDGEWRAELVAIGRKHAEVRVMEQTRVQAPEPDIQLCFAPIKLGRIDYLVEKATELGVSHLQPVMTERTQNKRIKQERLQAHAFEAAEQCERLSVPKVAELMTLDMLLAQWDVARMLIVADETGAGAPALDVLAEPNANFPCTVLIGPEGGFSDSELAKLAELPYVLRISLGPRILRADTAALAALTLVQAAMGDWAVGLPSCEQR